MELVPIAGSSLVAATGHDPATNTLRVRFNDGSLHEYAGVPAEAHEQLRAGGEIGSVGKHFHRAIKGQYSHTLVDEEKK